MPKPKRTPEEIEAVKNEILAHAIQLLIQEGYRGFSMRKLAARLEIAAKTIYNYSKTKLFDPFRKISTLHLYRYSSAIVDDAGAKWFKKGK